MRRILLTVVLLVSFLGVTATPAYAPTSCPGYMTNVDYHFFAWGTDAYVSAELSWTGDAYARLRARGSIGPWETFRLVCVQAPDVYAIRSVANGRYVSAEISWTGNSYGLLRARATSIGPWEKFRISVSHAVRISMLSLANNRYVSTEASWTGSSRGSLRARATTVGEWETYPLQ